MNDIVVKDGGRGHGKYRELMASYGLVKIDFSCENDNRYYASFLHENGDLWEYTSSRSLVLEHARHFAPGPSLYEKDKNLIVSHFKRMAMYKYQSTHLTKELMEFMANNI